MTLAEIRPGDRVRILAIPALEVRTQALRLGIGVGEVAVCRAIIPRGPVVLGKARQEIAIGRQLAEDIHVEFAQP
ncbi:MAG: ferrous iron transport protein A [Candidatus Sericytochromatia bacterium]|nr:ferrous iron transport protein A [Candidatus Sericytochromatia bacterium]